MLNQTDPERIYLLPSNNQHSSSSEHEAEVEKSDRGLGLSLTSDFSASLHVMKSSVGTGVLAMANGFKNAGLIFGIFGTAFIGLLCTHSTYIMVKCAEELCKMLNKPSLGFTETIECSMLYCAEKKFSHYARLAKNSADFFMFCTYYGVNTIYIIFVATTFQHIVENQLHIHHNVRLYILVTAIPVFLIGVIRTMKFLVPFSAAANFFICIGLCMTFFYVLQDLPPITSRPFIVKVTHWPFFISTAFFGMEGIGTIFPIKNSMKHPEHFLHFPGVLIIVMTVVIFLFITVGFFGYLKYGELAEDVIILNLPKQLLTECVKGLVALSVLFSYGLQLTASMDVVWKRLECKFEDDVKKIRYYQIRALLIFGTAAKREGSVSYLLYEILMSHYKQTLPKRLDQFLLNLLYAFILIALIIPNLGPAISLIGAFGFSMCGFFYPALVELVMRWNDSLGKWNYILWKNGFLISFSIIAAVTGCISSIYNIIEEYE